MHNLSGFFHIVSEPSLFTFQSLPVSNGLNGCIPWRQHDAAEGQDCRICLASKIMHTSCSTSFLNTLPRSPSVMRSTLVNQAILTVPLRGLKLTSMELLWVSLRSTSISQEIIKITTELIEFYFEWLCSMGTYQWESWVQFKIYFPQ